MTAVTVVTVVTGVSSDEQVRAVAGSGPVWWVSSERNEGGSCR
ncbi:hypothetical protein [Streptomyces montanus]|nr:hypothetical protein [Streptomyces montanus]